MQPFGAQRLLHTLFRWADQQLPGEVRQLGAAELAEAVLCHVVILLFQMACGVTATRYGATRAPLIRAIPITHIPQPVAAS